MVEEVEGTFQAEGPAKAEAQVGTKPRAGGTDQMPSERQVEADQVGIVRDLGFAPSTMGARPA